MRTFSIQTLGCKVNQYESDQIATVLRAHGLSRVMTGQADLEIINTCSVTMHAAKDSRAMTRKAIRPGVKTIVTGCWATSDKSTAEALGADAVLTHHDNVAQQLSALVGKWTTPSGIHPIDTSEEAPQIDFELPLVTDPRASAPSIRVSPVDRIGTHHLPLLNERQSGHQRAFLKIQDGCDAHCTYCIIPKLRPGLWSKPIDDVVQEARQLVDAGHQELILTGIFLGAYNQPTALRRRQTVDTEKPIGRLIDAVCTRVPNLRRLRLSSLEPGDLNAELIAILKSHPQVVPHFHLPLQSGSDLLLRRMNRQYTRDDFMRMVDEVNAAFDRPAITTDIIAGFPGESSAEFERTLEVVDHAKFIHIHAFSFSARPGTAAARWTGDFVHGEVVKERIAILNDRARNSSERYRNAFLGETVEVLVEAQEASGDLRHGRCERYFDVHFQSDEHGAGEAVKLRINRVTSTRSFGVPVRRSLRVVV